MYFLDAEPLWIQAFERNGPPCWNKVLLILTEEELATHSCKNINTEGYWTFHSHQSIISKVWSHLETQLLLLISLWLRSSKMCGWIRGTYTACIDSGLHLCMESSPARLEFRRYGFCFIYWFVCRERCFLVIAACVAVVFSYPMLRYNR